MPNLPLSENAAASFPFVAFVGAGHVIVLYPIFRSTWEQSRRGGMQQGREGERPVCSTRHKGDREI